MTDKADTIKKKAAMLQALEKTLGVVTTACRNVGVSRETHYKWLRIDEKYQKAVEDLNEVALDFGESQLHQLMKDTQPAAIIFYLKTKGKKRGYIERHEFEHGGSITINTHEGDKDL